MNTGEKIDYIQSCVGKGAAYGVPEREQDAVKSARRYLRFL